MSDELRALREKAEAATPGPWLASIVPVEWLSHLDPEDRSWTVDAEGRMVCPNVGWFKDSQAESDAQFIAAANPTAVLALLDRLEAAEATVAYHDDWRYCPRCGRPHDWAGELSPGAPCMICGRYPANHAALDAD